MSAAGSSDSAGGGLRQPEKLSDLIKLALVILGAIGGGFATFIVTRSNLETRITNLEIKMTNLDPYVTAANTSTGMVDGLSGPLKKSIDETFSHQREITEKLAKLVYVTHDPGNNENLEAQVALLKEAIGQANIAIDSLRSELDVQRQLAARLNLTDDELRPITAFVTTWKDLPAAEKDDVRKAIAENSRKLLRVSAADDGTITVSGTLRILGAGDETVLDGSRVTLLSDGVPRLQLFSDRSSSRSNLTMWTMSPESVDGGKARSMSLNWPKDVPSSDFPFTGRGP